MFKKEKRKREKRFLWPSENKTFLHSEHSEKSEAQPLKITLYTLLFYFISIFHWGITALWYEKFLPTCVCFHVSPPAIRKYRKSISYCTSERWHACVKDNCGKKKKNEKHCINYQGCWWIIRQLDLSTWIHSSDMFCRWGNFTKAHPLYVTELSVIFCKNQSCPRVLCCLLHFHTAHVSVA